MGLLLWIWISLGGLAAVVWLTRCILVGRLSRSRIRLGDTTLDDASRVDTSLADGKSNTFQTYPKVSILIAARDEEANIESCIRSLLAQDYPNVELIAIDDRSRDATPQILSRLRDEHPVHLQILTIREVADGWFGKNNAMREGTEVARGEWLLFTDADCRFTSPHAISLAMKDAIAQRADLLSIIPLLDAPTTWERIMQPVCALVLMLWFQPSRVNNPAHAAAYANGAFMLMRRQCYVAIGGHEVVRDQLNEDIHMARLVKQRGFRLRVVENDELYRTRMYATLRGALRGWSRIFAGSLSTPGRVGLALAVLFTFSVLPWIGLAVSLFALQPDLEANRTIAVSAFLWGLAVLFMQICIWRIYGLLNFGQKWSFAYFFGALTVFGILLSALAKVSGAMSTTWRGTTYRGASGCNVVRGLESAKPTLPARTPIGSTTIEDAV